MQKKKEILNFAYKQGLLFEKPKESDNFKKMYKINRVSKTREIGKYCKYICEK